MVVIGLKAALPTSFSQIWRRSCSSNGHFSPAATSSREISPQRSVATPSGVPMVKREPSMWRITPGSTISVEQ